ncbi:hypothetical protein FXN61_06235 [Lentzea sp. PSKA42]|uniref:Uncharacterized protein n=1 Tax=Lentzea indica TaxID=2604800 RepID=A0ABX1FCC7_9PSEU|nr:hypothetical protein [Lentzea indica]NKE56450.1 hypothetical protein [Lentzea indica]
MATETPLVRQLVRELATRASLSLDKLRRTGAIVVTTINPKAQSGATAAIRETAAAQSGAPLRYSVTSVDSASGAVKAYAPGNDPAVDHAGGVVKEPGSAFFPFTAVAALQEGKTLDLASAYATFAAEGVHRDAHFITHVTDVNGATLYRVLDTPQPAFDRDPLRSKEIANQVAQVLRDDPVCGSNPVMVCRPGVWPLDDPARIRHAWMIGYTPELSVSVFVGGDEAGGAVDAGLPKTVWQKFQQNLQP